MAESALFGGNLFGQEQWARRGDDDALLRASETRLTAVETKVALVSTGVWTAYTPTLTAASSNPFLGTGGNQLGRWTRSGRTISGNAFISFGPSGTPLAGGGEYRIAAPVPSVNLGYNVVVGGGYLYDASANVMEQVVVAVAATQTTYFVMFKNGAFGITDASPWGWSFSDHMSIQFNYEAAS